MVLLQEKVNEWRHEYWFCLVDFEKAFDTIEHEALWKCLKDQNVQEEYIFLLRKLYEGQTAYVRTDVNSRNFRLFRGVKQGDPLSAILFIAVMECCMGNLNARWSRLSRLRRGRGYGLDCTNSDGRLTNLRFADDIVLFASTKQDIVKMLRDLKREAVKFGLEIHFGKTVILTNNIDAANSKSVKVDGDSVKIASHGDSAKYLGRKLSVLNLHSVEIDHRTAAGWAAFTKFRSEFCGRYVNLNDKIRLFQATVTPTVLYGCATWTMNKEFEVKLRTARRRMLRLLFPWCRQRIADEHGVAELEPWVEWVQRVTHRIEEYLAARGVEDWVASQRKRKFRFAG